MRLWQRIFTFVLALLISLNSAPRARACGPEIIEPVFVFVDSPDLPFEEFTNGKIGIVQPTFGRKTLVIAYRYLNGGSFTRDEQEALVQALKGRAPEDNPAPAIKAWIAARKELMAEGEKLPEVYTERQHGDYDFFPNCTRNAFEVAKSTLKDRVASYGVADNGVHNWAAAQDRVFENCSTGAKIPDELGNGSPGWLRKDRDYQIAAALFYSLHFDEARRRFEKIAADNDSPWQETAGYLVARTLVRQASLAGKEVTKQNLYEQAEVTLQNLMGRSPGFYKASQKLLALVKYRLHPENRVRELARVLANQNGNENLRQDLIDYVWLVDKFEAQTLATEKERAAALQPPDKEKANPYYPFSSRELKERFEGIESGQLIEITIYLKKPDGTPDYAQRVEIDFKSDATQLDVLQAFEVKLGRKLTAAETKDISEMQASALSDRNWLISPNRKWDSGSMSRYEGCYYDCDKLTLDMVPAFLRFDDLGDWIFTLKSKDPQAYAHASSKWRETGAPAWLVTSLVKAEQSSPGVASLMRDAEKVGHDAPEFPTIAYQLVRLREALGKNDEARRLLDEIISWQPGTLPVSAQNQFAEQRARIAANMSEFLKFSQRKPAAFYKYGSPARIIDLMRIEKGWWDPEYMKETREEYEQQVEKSYQDLLPWDGRFTFDDAMSDIFNWHVPVKSLANAAHDPAVPSYLQRSLILAAWTRAILLKNDELALQIAPEVVKLAPEMTPLVAPYLKAPTANERRYAALYVLLKFPELSPFVASGLPARNSTEETSYDFETAWWCTLSNTEYREGNEVPKVVARPGFLRADQLDEAQRERTALVAIGNGKSYLGKQVLEWAKVSPQDPRIPEALFIAVRANDNYKYGCGGWESDEDIKEEAVEMLHELYPQSIWTAKLKEYDN